jgi:hypothetical protein
MARAPRRKWMGIERATLATKRMAKIRRIRRRIGR